MMDLESVDFVIDDVSMITTTSTASTSNADPEVNSVTSFNNIHYFLLHHKYPTGLNLNQKRTLRKAASNFAIIGEKLYYTGKNKKERRLVIFDDEGKKRIFRDCHDSAAGGHWGQKKTLEKIESLFFWRGMVKDIVGWIQTCETCLQKEDKRNFMTKRFRLSDSNEDTLTLDLPPINTQSSSPSALEKAQSVVKQLEKMLKQLQENEQFVLSMSAKAEQDIDDVLDHILSQIIKLASKKKREMKEQAEKKKNQSLSVLNHSRKQIECKLKAARKLVTDLEVAGEDNRSWSPLANRAAELSNSFPQMPLREEVGGLWTLFKTNKVCEQVGQVISWCGEVTEQPPFRISRVLEVPGSLRVGFEAIPDGVEQLGSTKLRLYCRTHNPSSLSDFSNVSTFINYGNYESGQLIPVNLISSSSDCYIPGLKPYQAYSVCISYLQDGMSDWSPWSFPFIITTSFPNYTWDSSNASWMLSENQDIATKFDNSDPQAAALYSPVLLSSSAQFFPGCKIKFTVLEALNIMDEDGFALIEQWVQGGTLCQEGTVFFNGQGQLYIDGKFHSQLGEPLRTGSVLTFDSLPPTNPSEDGIMKLNITISFHQNHYTFEWNLQSQISNVYFGMQFKNQGTRVQVE